MTRIETNQDGFVVDAALLSDAFNLESDKFQPLMWSGRDQVPLRNRR